MYADFWFRHKAHYKEGPKWNVILNLAPFEVSFNLFLIDKT